MLPFKLNANALKTLGFSSLLFSGLVSISSDAQALAVRTPDNSMTSKELCNQRYGFMGFFSAGATGISLSNDGDVREGRIKTACVWGLDGTTATTFEAVMSENRFSHTVLNHNDPRIKAIPADISYARDNRRLYYPLYTQLNHIYRVNIPGGGESGSLHYQFGHDIEHTLTKIGTDPTDGVAIWSVGATNDYVGLKMWSASSCGNDGIRHTKQSINAVNSNNFVAPGRYDGAHPYTTTQGAAIERNGAGCNFFAHLVTEVVLLKPDQITGVITIPQKVIGKVKFQSGNFTRLVGQIDRDITLSAMSFTFIPRTCSYNEQKDRNVKLDKIGLGHFANGRNEVYGGTTTINLTCPANSNVHSFVTFTDNANVNNTSNILSLSRGSTAKNVGVKVYVNDDQEAVKFGPLVLQNGTSGATRAIAKQDYAREVAPASNAAQTHSLKLTAKYARTNNEPITPGKVNGEMIFNFSYY